MTRRFMLLLLGSATGLALWFTWPLAALLTSHVAGRSVDAEQFLWSFWWFREALAVRHDGRLVTFDRRIAVEAVADAQNRHLATLND